MTRVLTTRGKSSLLIVAPHGHPSDDINTDIMADLIASELNGYSVINTGWERAKKAVIGHSLANLNDIDHCKLKPVFREFLRPILEFKKEIIAKHGRCHVFYMHGMSNKIRRDTKYPVDIVIGYGSGSPPSYTCDHRYKNAFVTRLREENFLVYQGKPGGRFSAWKTSNLTQLFRQHDLDHRVQSMQLEVVNLRRHDENTAKKTALTITRALDKFLYSETVFSKNMFIEEY